MESIKVLTEWALQKLQRDSPTRPDDLANPKLAEWNARLEASQAERAAKMAEAIADRQWEVWDTCGIPSTLTDADLHAGRPTPALLAAREYVRDMGDDDGPVGPALVLAGPTGVGKSWAAAAVARETIRGCRSKRALRDDLVTFRYFPALCGALLDQAQRRGALERVKETSVLVLDDVGVEYVKDGGLIEAFFDELIWHREGNRMATVFTTNLTPEQMSARFSARVYDRLRGWARIIACPGESLRGAR